MDLKATLGLLGILATSIAIGTIVYRKYHKGYWLWPPTTTLPGATPAAVPTPRSTVWWERIKKLKWATPVIIWILFLLYVKIVQSEFFGWWFAQTSLFIGVSYALLLFGLIWGKDAGTLGKKLLSAAILILLALNAYQTVGGQHLGISLPRDMYLPEIRQFFNQFGSLTYPHGFVVQSTHSKLVPLDDSGVPWTPLEKEGLPGYVCVLNPGETSAFAPRDPVQFEFMADSQLIVIINGKEHFLNHEYLTANQTGALGMQKGANRRLRFKLPENEKEQTPIFLVSRL